MLVMVDQLDVTVVAVVEVMDKGTLLIGTLVPRNQLPLHQPTTLHKSRSLLNEVLKTGEVSAVAPTVITTMPDTRDRLTET